MSIFTLRIVTSMGKRLVCVHLLLKYLKTLSGFMPQRDPKNSFIHGPLHDYNGTRTRFTFFTSIILTSNIINFINILKLYIRYYFLLLDSGYIPQFCSFYTRPYNLHKFGDIFCFAHFHWQLIHPECHTMFTYSSIFQLSRKVRSHSYAVAFKMLQTKFHLVHVYSTQVDISKVFHEFSNQVTGKVTLVH